MATSPTAVEELIQHVGLAAVLPGAVPFKFMNVSSTFRGRVAVAGGGARLAFIKDLPAKELANELLAAHIALSLGLPTPKPYLGRVAEGELPIKEAPKTEDGKGFYVLVTEDAATPSIMQIARSDDQFAFESARRQIATWSGCGGLYAFDNWIANIDRNVGNVLFSSGTVQLIDHGQCFTGSAWKASGLNPGEHYEDRLYIWLTPVIKLDERPARLHEGMGLLADRSAACLQKAATLSYASRFLTDEDSQALRAFMKDRLTKIESIVSESLGLAGAA